ncbi:hypothetical protein CEUSTIGMA_g10706.t1 [Chlamydomonas eustigma]|uniref:Uncharacterized protein n=1 Tax=Chlamydomonas eustigma TaxID=1157962 RepID=A0A250XKE7_9CHLO|nr:hypothetical protein CEUSTIGMA_g10706.t1 [Chlamydomonas eustigma]|eukprot:GAX83280.1 hypothetical protein CEUSTIGMA_g10706.t1 [Chlamydomonas eustigma]
MRSLIYKQNVVNVSKPRSGGSVVPALITVDHAFPHTSCRISKRLISMESAADGPSPSQNGDDQPKAVALPRQLPSIGYTFVLAGFLKILTMFSLASSAPQDTVRTALGHTSQFLLVPGGLLMCWVAKLIVDSNLQESKKFMAGLVAVLVFLYFFIYKLLFKYDVAVEMIRGPRPTMSGPMAEVRARAGDRDRSGLMLRDSRSYESDRVGQYNDLSYYEGRYPSQIKADADAEESHERSSARGSTRVSAAELEARNPLRTAYRRAPGTPSVGTSGYID